MFIILSERVNVWLFNNYIVHKIAEGDVKTGSRQSHVLLSGLYWFTRAKVGSEGEKGESKD